MEDKNPWGIETPRGRGPYRNNRRQQMIDGALRLFAYHGYDAVTNKMLEEETGIATSGIYKLFGGKENLARVCMEQFMENFTAEIAALSRMSISYDEHTKRASEIFKRHQDGVRFLIGLTATPKNAHIAKGVWTESLVEWGEILRVYEPQVKPGDFLDLVYLVTALHFSYCLGRNEERYESARKALMKHFLNGD